MIPDEDFDDKIKAMADLIQIDPPFKDFLTKEGIFYKWGTRTSMECIVNKEGHQEFLEAFGKA